MSLQPWARILLRSSCSLLETVDQCFIGYTVYYYAITNFDSPLVLIVGSVLWSLLLQLLLGAFVGAIVKLCFAMRVWRCKITH